MSASSPAARIQANLQELFREKSASGSPYIKFQLTTDITALLSMEQVQETSIVEATLVTPLPSMPPSVIGIINSRDRVFCIFDLAGLLSLPHKLTAPRQYQIIVLQTSDPTPIQLALAVNSLQGIMRLTAEQIHSSTDDVAAKIIPYISGVAEAENTTIPVLEFERILKAIAPA